MVASFWGDANYGAPYELLNMLRRRVRYLVDKWPSVKEGDCSFGGTVHIIRMILDVYEEGTVFITDEVDEWNNTFQKLHKRAKKRLPNHVSLEAYKAQVLEDLSVIRGHSTNSEPRERWEVIRSRDVEEYKAWLEWRKAFVKQFRESQKQE
ncbi:MAG: hypothetical protein ACTHK7_24745 [Aureliella sp.]